MVASSQRFSTCKGDIDDDGSTFDHEQSRLGSVLKTCLAFLDKLREVGLRKVTQILYFR